MIASERCYELAQSLYSMSTEIPHERVQTAVNRIAQCNANVLTVTFFVNLCLMKPFSSCFRLLSMVYYNKQQLFLI